MRIPDRKAARTPARNCVLPKQTSRPMARMFRRNHPKPEWNRRRLRRRRVTPRRRERKSSPPAGESEGGLAGRPGQPTPRSAMAITSSPPMLHRLRTRALRRSQTIPPTKRLKRIRTPRPRKAGKAPMDAGESASGQRLPPIRLRVREPESRQRKTSTQPPVPATNSSRMLVLRRLPFQLMCQLKTKIKRTLTLLAGAVRVGGRQRIPGLPRLRTSNLTMTHVRCCGRRELLASFRDSRSVMSTCETPGADR